MTAKRRPSDLRSSQLKLRVSTALQVKTSYKMHSVPYMCAGTGKTHALIEIIRQLTSNTPVNPRPLRLLVCGASNLSVDNILERLLALPAPSQGTRLVVTRIGHPARVIQHEGALNSTLEAQAERSDEVRGLRTLFVDALISRRPLWRET
jgi:hypothetical protein